MFMVFERSGSAVMDISPSCMPDSMSTEDSTVWDPSGPDPDAEDSLCDDADDPAIVAAAFATVLLAGQK
jgi:hypothetical protein